MHQTQWKNLNVEFYRSGMIFFLSIMIKDYESHSIKEMYWAKWPDGRWTMIVPKQRKILVLKPRITSASQHWRYLTSPPLRNKDDNSHHLQFATKTTTYLTSDSQQRWQRTSPPIRNKDDNAQFKSREFTKWNQSLSFIPIVFKVSGR